MSIFLKSIIKAIVLVSLAIATVYVIFAGSIYSMMFFGTNLAGAAWLFGWLVAIVSFLLVMGQEESQFSQKITQIGKAFWAW